jgi:hypothetical protein
MLQTNALPVKKKGRVNKLILGFAALAATAVIGTTGLAGATANTKPTKEQCAAAGFPNYGQCIKAWAAAKNHQGGGYGGNDNRVVKLNLELNNSNRNVINVIINFFN